MKNITRIFSLVVVLVMAFSVASFAADFAHTFTVTTNATTAKLGDSVIVTVDITGPMAGVAAIQYSIVYDTDKFSVNTATDRTNGYKCYDSSWYTPIKNTANQASDATNNLGYIAKPGCGENPKGSVNVSYLSTDGYYIDEGSDLYTGVQTVTAGKIIFTAKADVDKIDSSCFTVTNAKVADTDAKVSTVTVEQIKATETVKTITKSDSKIVPEATTIGDKTTDTQIGAAVGIQFTAPAGVTLQNKMIWAVETSAGRKYSKAVDVDFSGITGTVTVAATFHNGIHENSFGVAPVAPLGITGVDAIFTDGTNDYYTNAADKEAKAE